MGVQKMGDNVIILEDSIKLISYKEEEIKIQHSHY